MSSLDRKAFGVGGSILLIELWEDSDLVGEVFKGVGRRGLRAGRGMGEEEGMLVWIFRGEGGGTGRDAGVARKGLFEA